MTSLWQAFGRLAAAGLAIDFAPLWKPFGEIRDPKLTAKPKLTLKIKGANYGKLYPPPGGAAELPPPNPPRSAIEQMEEIRREPIPEAVAPAATVEPSPQVAAGSEWLQAYQEAQRQTIDAHLAFQKSMVEAQTAFLQTVEASFTGLRQPWDMPVDTELPQPELRPVFEPLPEPAAQPPVSMERNRRAPPAPVVAAERPAASPPAAAEAPAAAASGGVELEGLMLDVVAEKTGYPPEMLNLEMDLESDLVIDSIKRVEILAAVRDREPDLPEVDTTQLATLRTLGQIVDFLADRPTAATPPPAASTDGVDVEGLMLEIVAEKTGYPPEMLNLEMDLESDLGIDSIKRVEILAAVRDREPDLPEVDTTQLATLRTLGQIVDFLGVSQDAEAAAPQTVTAATVASAPAPPVGRYALRPVPAPAAGLAIPGLATARRVAVTDDGGGIAIAVVAELARKGVAAEVVSEDSMLGDATAVLILDGLSEATDLDQAFEINRRAFRVARAAAPQVADGGILVTVQDTGGDFGFSETSPIRAALGGLAGLAKTAALEWPAAAVRAIDVERGERSPAEIASVLVEELFDGGAELEVGLRADGSRLTLESYAAPLGELPDGKRPGGVIVASGGARGVTAATLLALARETDDLHLVLLGRTSLEEEPAACRGVEGEAELKRAMLKAAREAGEQLTPLELTARVRRVLAGREIRQNLAALAAAGATARYLPADVRDPDSVAAAVQPVRREWGPITGIVHGAGVIADKPLAEKTNEQFDRVFDTKVRGLTALLAATADDPLRLICLFSSVSARCGNVGQVDYAMANEVLNKIAAAERRRRLADGCLVKSLNWGPWEGGMVTPELKARFEALGVPLIPLDAGAQMLVGELTGAAPAEQVEVVLGGDPNQGLRAAAGGGTLEMDAVVDARSYPYLESHSIDGVPVVPVVMAIEWFARIASAHCPDLRLAGCRDIEVVRGILLERFHDRAEVLRISSRVASGSRVDGCELALEIRDRDGALRYRAIAEMVSGAQEPPGAGPAASGLQPWTEAEIYDGEVLFHGPQLQVIREIEGISDQGIAGRLAGSREMGWGNDSWRTDAAALDGGLQLAVLWFKHQRGEASLPMKVGTFKSYTQMPPSGPLRAVLRNRLVGADRAVADIVLSNGDGSRMAELREVEIYRRPPARKTAAAAPVVAASGKIS
ncbi:MAG: SDR family oxidoreductase [Thermoanaerobaculia bacterium]